MAVTTLFCSLMVNLIQIDSQNHKTIVGPPPPLPPDPTVKIYKAKREKREREKREKKSKIAYYRTGLYNTVE